LISSVISGIIANAYKANGGTELGSNEWSDGKGLDLYETTFRSYNAQTGRFMQVDPLMESTANLGGYTFGANNPIYFEDPLGLASIVMTPLLLLEWFQKIVDC
jgi:RHS repeat-associated protein